MIKGISQSHRNNAWHSRNTVKKAKRRISHHIRLALYNSDQSGFAKEMRAEERKKAMNMADKAKESYGTLSYWERFKLFISRLYSRYAT